MFNQISSYLDNFLPKTRGAWFSLMIIFGLVEYFIISISAEYAPHEDLLNALSIGGALVSLILGGVAIWMAIAAGVIQRIDSEASSRQLGQLSDVVSQLERSSTSLSSHLGELGAISTKLDAQGARAERIESLISVVVATPGEGEPAVEVIADMIFEQEDVDLDGKQFVRCEFKDCRLIFHGRQAFGMTECNGHTSPFIFADSAMLTVGAMALMRRGGMSKAVDDVIGDITSGALADQIERQKTKRRPK